jgi:uncharacterized protein (TIRG00374 family)
MSKNQVAEPTRTRGARVAALILGIFVLAAVVLIVLDWQQVRQILGKSNLELTFVALLFTVISYFCLSLGYVIVNEVFSIRVSWRELFEVGLVSTALNNILAFMGAAGHSLRLLLIGRYKVQPGGILAASIFHSYLNNVMMLIFPVIGLVWVLIGHLVRGGTATIFAILAVVLALVVAIATIIMFNYRIRSRVLRVINGLWHLITRRNITQFITELDTALDNGVTALRNNRTAFIYLLVLMAAFWAFAAAALWFCFFALGRTPNVGILFCGFGIGIIAGNLSLIPGGLGVQEASLAGVFALLGTSFAEAALASILFRVVYDFIPFFLSLLLYNRLIRRKNKSV